MVFLAALSVAVNVQTGADVLAATGFKALHGKRIGFVTNHTALVGKTHLADLLARDKNIKLVALFGPEHGIRGEADAGAAVGDSVDKKTGIPVFSLYGKTRRPTPEMLSGCDLLLYDIQDIGARYYTYISTLGLCMQSAAEAGIPFIVLDRPNPLGGAKVEGPVLELEHRSYVGQYPVPVRYGLTVGELARMIKGERWMPGLENLDLDIVKVVGWKRAMLWPATGLPWMSPSPNIPDYETCLAYPGTCLFEATSASEGRGTLHPFVTIGTHGIDPEAFARNMNSVGLKGVRFEPARFTPRSIPGMSSSPKLLGKPLAGVRLRITDHQTFEPVKSGLALLCAFYAASPQAGRATFIREESLARLSGTSTLARSVRQGVNINSLSDTWKPGIQGFLVSRQKYLLYP